MYCIEKNPQEIKVKTVFNQYSKPYESLRYVHKEQMVKSGFIRTTRETNSGTLIPDKGLRKFHRKAFY